MRIVISALLALHVAAVFVGPWSMPPYESELSAALGRAMSIYIRGASLDNGYRFFAPEPGPSHLIRYELQFDDGSRLEGIFPNLEQEWPRLLYHRHFMLSEFANTLDNPDFENPALTSMPVPAEWQSLASLKALHDNVVKSYAAHLAHKFSARQVSLYLRRHNIPLPEEVARGVSLADPRWNQEKLLGTFDAGELP
jgi:hypothetical protein